MTPGSTYYLVGQCDNGFAESHGFSSSTNGKGTLWLYALKTYDPSNNGYDSPWNYTSSNVFKIIGKTYIWKVDVPTGYNMVRIRLNGYSDGTSKTFTFRNIHLFTVDGYNKYISENLH